MAKKSKKQILYETLQEAWQKEKRGARLHNVGVRPKVLFVLHNPTELPMLDQHMRDLGKSDWKRYPAHFNVFYMFPNAEGWGTSMAELRAAAKYLSSLTEDLWPCAMLAFGLPAWKCITEDGQRALVKERRIPVHNEQGTARFCTWGAVDMENNPIVGPWITSDIEYVWDWVHAIKGATKLREDYCIPATRGYPNFSINKRQILDVETTGFDPRLDSLRAIGWQDIEDWDVRDKSSVVIAHTKADIKEVLDRAGYDMQLKSGTGVYLCGANVGFDLKFLLPPFGRYIPNVRLMDLCFNAYLLDCNYPLRGLKHQLLLYTPHRPYVEDGFNPAEAESEELLPYLAKDVRATKAVLEGQLKEFEADNPKALRFAEGLMSKVLTLLAVLEHHGIPVDSERLADTYESEIKLINHLRSYLVDGYVQLCKQHGVDPHPEFDLTKPHLVSDFLFGVCHLPKLPGETRKDGGHRVTSDVLTKIKETGGINPSVKDWINALLEYRDVNDNHVKYVRNVYYSVHPDTGCLHPKYSVWKSTHGQSEEGTETGRLAVRDPAIHNIPKGHRMRDAIVPFEKDGYLLQADLKQAELVGLAWYSQDRSLIEALSLGEDLHNWMVSAAASRGISITRDQAKMVNFGILYGIGAPGLAQRLGCDKSKAQALLDLWFNRFRSVAKWKYKIETEAKRRGYVETPYGRRRYFPDVNWNGRTKEDRTLQNRILRQCANTLIQSWASDVNLSIAYHMSVYAQDCYGAGNVFPITLIHDSVLWAVDKKPQQEELLGTFSRYCRQAMPTHLLTDLGVNLPCDLRMDLKAGPNWGAMKDAGYLLIPKAHA